ETLPVAGAPAGRAPPAGGLRNDVSARARAAAVVFRHEPPRRRIARTRADIIENMRLRRVCLALAAAMAAAAVHAADRTPDVLISRQLAEPEHLSVGSTMRLSHDQSGADARAFRVAGIYEPTPDPAKLGATIREVQMHLPDLLEMTREPGAPAGS